MAGYSPYELLHEIIERVAWRSEGEKAIAHESVNEWQSVNLFGNYALLLSCQHEEVRNIGYPPVSICGLCGRRM